MIVLTDRKIMKNFKSQIRNEYDLKWYKKIDHKNEVE